MLLKRKTNIFMLIGLVLGYLHIYSQDTVTTQIQDMVNAFSRPLPNAAQLQKFLTSKNTTLESLNIAKKEFDAKVETLKKIADKIDELIKQKSTAGNKTTPDTKQQIAPGAQPTPKATPKQDMPPAQKKESDPSQVDDTYWILG